MVENRTKEKNSKKLRPEERVALPVHVSLVPSPVTPAKAGGQSSANYMIPACVGVAYFTYLEVVRQVYSKQRVKKDDKKITWKALSSLMFFLIAQNLMIIAASHRRNRRIRWAS